MNKGFAPLVVIVLIIVAVLAVGIGGNFALKSRVVVAPTQSPSPTSTVTSTPDETASWKTYTNAEYSFEFKYPGSLITSETKGSSNQEKRFTSILIDTDANIKLLKSANGTEGIQPFLEIGGHEPQSKPANDCDESYTSSKVTIDDLTVTKCVGQSMFGPGSMYISFTKNEVVYYIIKSDKYLDSDKLVIDQILSTFKFTTPSATPISQNNCKVTGCSNQICVDSNAKDFVTTCEMRAEYACYQKAKCERQTNGQCGFTITNEIRICLDNTKS